MKKDSAWWIAFDYIKMPEYLPEFAFHLSFLNEKKKKNKFKLLFVHFELLPANWVWAKPYRYRQEEKRKEKKKVYKNISDKVINFSLTFRYFIEFRKVFILDDDESQLEWEFDVVVEQLRWIINLRIICSCHLSHSLTVCDPPAPNSI